MPVSSSRLSYSDCFALYERALADKTGARYQVPPGEYGKNKYFVMRMHQARAIDRKDNKALYEVGDPMYGHSPYDVLIVRLLQDTEGLWWVYALHTEIEDGEIEALSEIETPAEAAS